MNVSICIATYNKEPQLRVTLDSIYAQGEDVEIIVVDDGSTDNTEQAVRNYPQVKYAKLHDALGIYRNPAVARNVAYRMASQDIVISQSDEIQHIGKVIAPLAGGLRQGEFHIATVLNFDEKFQRDRKYTGIDNRRPLFFLGALWRADIYAAGGNDEAFKYPSCEDLWFAECLLKGLKLKCVYRDDVVGRHTPHKHVGIESDVGPSFDLLEAKMQNAVTTGSYTTTNGPWPGVPVNLNSEKWAGKDLRSKPIYEANKSIT